MTMACIATWTFGLGAVEVASKSIERGSDCVEAVETAINCRCCIIIFMHVYIYYVCTYVTLRYICMYCNSVCM